MHQSITRKLSCICVCLLLLVVMCSCIRTKTTENLSDYLCTDAPLLYDHVSFPNHEDLLVDAVTLYRSESKSSLLFDDLYFLLCCSYTKESYMHELERIVESGAEYREDLFSSPAYVMLLTENCYEYVLQGTTDNSLIYVYAQTADWNIFDGFPAEYLPLDKGTFDICNYSNQ